MNLTQVKCLAVFSIFAIIGFGPISPGCLIGMYIVLMRPKWFWHLVGNLYENYQPYQLNYSEESKKTRIKTFVFLVCLFVIDIAPIPVTPVVAFCIILSRPLWFYRIVAGIYRSKKIFD